MESSAAINTLDSASVNLTLQGCPVTSVSSDTGTCPTQTVAFHVSVIHRVLSVYSVSLKGASASVGQVLGAVSVAHVEKVHLL